MPRVLLVEDEIGAIAAVKRSLTRAGFEVLVATNLPDALSAAENERPELLLVAAGLHGESAQSVVEALRATDLVRPLVVMGDAQGSGEPSVPRPVDSQALIALLHQLLPTPAHFDEPTNPSFALTALPGWAFAPPAGGPNGELDDETAGGLSGPEEEWGQGDDPSPSGPTTPVYSPPPALEPPAEAAPSPAASPATDLARRRELAARALAEAQARRKAAEQARLEAESAHAAAQAPTAAKDSAKELPARRSATQVMPPAPALASRKPLPPVFAPVLPTAPSVVRMSRLPVEAPPEAPPTDGPLHPAASSSSFDGETTVYQGGGVGRHGSPSPRAPEYPDAPFDDRGEPVRSPRAPAPSPAGQAALSKLGAELFDDLAPELPTDPPPRAAPRHPEPRRLASPDSRAETKTDPHRPSTPAGPVRPAGSTSPPEREPPPRAPFPPEGLSLPLEGSLDRIEPAALLIACHRARLSGQLLLDQGQVQRVLYLGDGRLSGAASTSPEERLEALTYRRGLITRDQQRQLRAEAANLPTRRLALLMVERSYLKPAELFPLVQERVEEVVYEACGGFVGSYRIGPETVSDDERVALSRSPLALATESIRRKYLMERLLVGLGGPATLLRPAESTGPELSEFGLTARERRLAQAVDGLRNIEEILFESGIEPLPGLKVLYALLLGRTVEVAVRGIATEATPDVEARIDLARVGEKYEQVRSANYFEVLGVPPAATAYEIQQAYERLAREFQPQRFRELRRPELPGQLEEIQRILAEARDILVDTGLREEYRAHLRK